MSVHFKICLYMPVAPPTDKKIQLIILIQILMLVSLKVLQ